MAHSCEHVPRAACTQLFGHKVDKKDPSLHRLGMDVLITLYCLRSHMQKRTGSYCRSTSLSMLQVGLLLVEVTSRGLKGPTLFSLPFFFSFWMANNITLIIINIMCMYFAYCVYFKKLPGNNFSIRIKLFIILSLIVYLNF